MIDFERGDAQKYNRNITGGQSTNSRPAGGSDEWAKRPPNRRSQVILCFENRSLVDFESMNERKGRQIGGYRWFYYLKLVGEIGLGNLVGKLVWEIGWGNGWGNGWGIGWGNWFGKLVWEIGLGNWLGKWLICWNHFSNWFNVLVINFCVESLFRFKIIIKSFGMEALTYFFLFSKMHAPRVEGGDSSPHPPESAR